MLLMVKLDDPRFGAGPATVVAIVRDLAEYNTRITDTDGARDNNYRLWQGNGFIGERVMLSGG